MIYIILASASPRRHALMEQINLKCSIHPADIDENETPWSSPDRYTLELSGRKAQAVAKHYSNHLIIAADTVVSLDDRLLNKPDNPQHAFEYLKTLSGRTHQVTTGVTLVDSGEQKQQQFAVTTDVTFDQLSEEDIHSYIATGSPMDKAGAYGIQDDWGALFVSEIHGDYYNVVGFPLNRFYRELRAFAPRFLPRPVSTNT